MFIIVEDHFSGAPVTWYARDDKAFVSQMQQRHGFQAIGQSDQSAFVAACQQLRSLDSCRAILMTIAECDDLLSDPEDEEWLTRFRDVSATIAAIKKLYDSEGLSR